MEWVLQRIPKYRHTSHWSWMTREFLFGDLMSTDIDVSPGDTPFPSLVFFLFSTLLSSWPLKTCFNAFLYPLPLVWFVQWRTGRRASFRRVRSEHLLSPGPFLLGHSELAVSLYYRALVRQPSQNSANLFLPHPFRHRVRAPTCCESETTTLPLVGFPQLCPPFCE